MRTEEWFNTLARQPMGGCGADVRTNNNNENGGLGVVGINLS